LIPGIGLLRFLHRRLRGMRGRTDKRI